MQFSKVGRKKIDTPNRYCEVCGVLIVRNTKIGTNRISPKQYMKARFCSSKCHGVSHGIDITGDKNHKWNGGITPLYTKIRFSSQYKVWRTNIFKRDNFKCKACDSHKKLEVHHIFPFAKIIKDNKIKTFEDAIECARLWDSSNGMTMCIDCHKLTDSYKKKNI